VEGKPKFQRTFLIFNQEDKGYGTGQEPSGYTRIEVRGDKGKLFASVQNLKEEQDKFVYKLYLLRLWDNKATAVCAGVIPLSKGRGELNWEFDARNVGMTGIPIEEFTIAAVLVEYAAEGNTTVICPLAAYKGSKAAWRHRLGEALRHVKAHGKEAEKEILSREDTFAKYAANTTSKYIPPENNPKFNIPEEAEKKFDQSRRLAQPAEEGAGRQAGAGEGLSQVWDGKKAGSSEAAAARVGQAEPAVSGEAGSDEDEKQPSGETKHPSEETERNEERRGDLQDRPGQYKAAGADAESSQGPSGNGSCSAQPDGNNTKPCAGRPACQAAATAVQPDRAAAQPGKGAVDITKLMREFDRYFQREDPFLSRRRDYRWWKVNSPVHLNNILYQNNVKSSILFNPAVMMAHFKYRHLIIGVYIDVMRRREYLVCGVPGVYSVDEKPFGDMCRWVQLEGSRPKYGAFGYWLIYMEPGTGKILSFS